MLELDRVTKSFGSHTVLHPTTLTFAEGTTTVLIGPSGCGKSTLLRIMIGLIQPDSGSVRFQGEVFSAANQLEMRHRIGYVIQDAVADAMTYVEEALSERLSRWGVAPTPPPKGGSGRVNGVGNKPAKPEAAAAPARSTPRTLTNTMAAQPASPPAEMSEAELRKAAATLIRFV